MTPRDVARRVLVRVDRDAAYSTLALDAELEHEALPPRDRRLVTELVYGTLRFQGRLDTGLSAVTDLKRAKREVVVTLRMAAYQLWFMRVPAHAAVDDAVLAVRRFGGAKVGGFVNAVLRRLVKDGEPAFVPPAGGDPLAVLAHVHALPRWILDQLVAVRPDDVEAAAAGFAAVPRLAVRVNLRRTTVDEVTLALRDEGAEVEPVEGLAEALWVRGVGAVAASPSYQRGWWSAHDVAAQQVARWVDAAPGQRVLDACSGLGGKACHLAERVPGVWIDAVDRAPQKLALARAHATRLGLSEIHPQVGDLTELAGIDGLAETYPWIILDAPCSGLGVMRRHPEAKWKKSRADVLACAALQTRLLDALVTRLAPGGRLIYVVCTFTPAETDRQMAAVCERHPGLRLERTHRTWPDRDAADAFYLAQLHRA